MRRAAHTVLMTSSLGAMVGLFAFVIAANAQNERGPRSQPDTQMGLYAPDQHELYDGRFVIRGSRIYQAGTLNDESPWDHMGDDASDLRSVGGSVSLDVNEIENTGTFRARAGSAGRPVRCRAGSRA